MCPVIRATNQILIAAVLFASLSSANPGDTEVERFLREHRMDQLLEVQLETRLDQAVDQEERIEIATSLSELYLSQLRALEREDPYRQIVLNRARSLADRAPAVPMNELRLELLVDAFVQHENAIELAHLRLLDDASRSRALAAMKQAHRGLTQLLAGSQQDFDRLSRRRTSTRTLQAQTRLEEELDTLRRLNSFGNYYLGWSGYGIAVLEQRHVERDTYAAFGQLLGAEGSIPLSKDLHLAAVEFEHVARSVIGIAMCEAQSENYGLARIWLEGLLGQESLPASVPSEARRRLLRVLALGAEWHAALTLALEIRSNTGDGRLTIADARFVAIETLEARSARKNEDAEKLVTLCVEQLVDQREIGHVVDLYQRYQHLPMIGSGFIPMYARALAELERTESEESDPSYSIVIDLLSRAVHAADADNYPADRDDCRLKLAYALVRDDKPREAMEQCQHVLNASLVPDLLEEARWIRIAAVDRANALKGKRASSELEDAIRSYIERYAGTQRARTLVLRYATQGLLDPQVAIDTLSAVPESDPNAQAARRLHAQLKYEMLRASGFSDIELLRDTRNLLVEVVESETENEPVDARVSTLQIAIDLALRDIPADAQRARELIRRARDLLDEGALKAQLEPEFATQLIRAALAEGEIDLALVHLNELRAIQPDRADDSEVLILNHVINAWESGPDSEKASLLVRLGVTAIARGIPPKPERFGVQQSALMEVVAQGAGLLYDLDQDDDMLALALRLSKHVLEFGQPSEPGLRLTASLATKNGDIDTALEAWLRLLAAYPQGELRWYEARYESLALMQAIDPARALETYRQYRILNPKPAPDPWAEKISSLFHDPNPAQDSGPTP